MGNGMNKVMSLTSTSFERQYALFERITTNLFLSFFLTPSLFVFVLGSTWPLHRQLSGLKGCKSIGNAQDYAYTRYS